MTFKPFVADPKQVDAAYSSDAVKFVDANHPPLSKLIEAWTSIRKELYPPGQFASLAPATIWHYTTADATRLILEKGVLRMTNARFQNDSSEYEFAVRVIRDHVEEWAKVLAVAGDSDLSEVAKKHLALLEESTVYVCCFSGVRDQLSQWNGYAPRGYAIGFQPQALNDIVMSRPELRLHPCLYSPSHQKTLVHAALKDIELGFASFKKATADAKLAAEAAGIFAEVVFGQLLPYFKHPKFVEEAEWRVSALPAHVEQPKPLKLLTRGRGFAPYTELAFRSGDEPSDENWTTVKTKHPVTEVMIAPPAGDEASGLIPTGLAYALLRYGYHGVLISGSDIPHRVF
jgi:hypothetical protein